MARGAGHSRWYVTGRTLAAIFLGYLFASTSCLVVALALPVDRLTGVAIGTLLTFLVWGGAIMWAFAVERTRTVVLGLGGGTVLSGLIAWGLYLVKGAA
ncbi:MAG: DUF3649 domain-containing protein [Pseudomonadota bacterium]